MKIIVTGANGKLGRASVDELIDHGHDVFAIDRVPTPRRANVESSVVDLGDYGQVVDAITGIDARPRGFDAVVHLGAIPGPGLAANQALFLNNIAATSNVFAAARLARTPRVVWASSETLLGVPFDAPPPYVPVDEGYPARPETAYSVGKALEEELARYHARWRPDASIVGLRFSNVMTVADYDEFDSWQNDPALRAWNLWAYVDARDGAQAIRLALENGGPGAETYVIAAGDTVMRQDTETLLQQGGLAHLQRRHPLPERSSLLNSAEAHEQLGYSPRHSWLDKN
jgi:nucleoside-diphosphate-sugar epimerase